MPVNTVSAPRQDYVAVLIPVEPEQASLYDFSLFSKLKTALTELSQLGFALTAETITTSVAAAAFTFYIETKNHCLHYILFSQIKILDHRYTTQAATESLINLIASLNAITSDTITSSVQITHGVIQGRILHGVIAWAELRAFGVTPEQFLSSNYTTIKTAILRAASVREHITLLEPGFLYLYPDQEYIQCVALDHKNDLIQWTLDIGLVRTVQEALKRHEDAVDAATERSIAESPSLVSRGVKLILNSKTDPPYRTQKQIDQRMLEGMFPMMPLIVNQKERLKTNYAAQYVEAAKYLEKDFECRMSLEHFAYLLNNMHTLSSLIDHACKKGVYPQVLQHAVHMQALSLHEVITSPQMIFILSHPKCYVWLLQAGIPPKDINAFPHPCDLIIQAEHFYELIVYSEGRAKWDDIKNTPSETLKYLIQNIVTIRFWICDHVDFWDSGITIKPRLLWNAIAATECSVLTSFLEKENKGPAKRGIEDLADHGLTWDMLLKIPAPFRNLLLLIHTRVHFISLLKTSKLSMTDFLALVGYDVDTFNWLINRSTKIERLIKELQFSLEELMYLQPLKREFVVIYCVPHSVSVDGLLKTSKLSMTDFLALVDYDVDTLNWLIKHSTKIERLIKELQFPLRELMYLQPLKREFVVIDCLSYSISVDGLLKTSKLSMTDFLALVDYDVDTLNWLIKHSTKIERLIKESQFSLEELMRLPPNKKEWVILHCSIANSRSINTLLKVSQLSMLRFLELLNYNANTLSWLINNSTIIATMIKEVSFSLYEFAHVAESDRAFVIENNVQIQRETLCGRSDPTHPLYIDGVTPSLHDVISYIKDPIAFEKLRESKRNTHPQNLNIQSSMQSTISIPKKYFNSVFTYHPPENTNKTLQVFRTIYTALRDGQSTPSFFKTNILTKLDTMVYVGAGTQLEYLRSYANQNKNSRTAYALQLVESCRIPDGSEAILNQTHGVLGQYNFLCTVSLFQAIYLYAFKASFFSVSKFFGYTIYSSNVLTEQFQQAKTQNTIGNSSGTGLFQPRSISDRIQNREKEPDPNKNNTRTMKILQALRMIK